MPHPIDLARELRETLGLPAGALPITPRQAWDEAIAEVERLRAGNDEQHRPATVSVTESLECDGVSVSAQDASGRQLAMTVIGRKRIYRHERITYEIGGPLNARPAPARGDTDG